MFETKGDAFAFNVLLTDNSNNLEEKGMTSLHKRWAPHLPMQQGLTCEMLILDPLAPDTTMDLKLLYSDKDFWAEEPVLSLASLRIRLTWFSNVCRRVFPGVGSSSLLWAFSMTCTEGGMAEASDYSGGC